ncbi:TPA: hypothetical protein DEP96_01005 [Candidatus Uhrbacteria bacterium]|nr:hypothetical protein [Candidatus Uhrbacteria bacterium]
MNRESQMISNEAEVSRIVDCDGALHSLPPCVQSVLEHVANSEVNCTTLRLHFATEVVAGQTVICQEAIDQVPVLLRANIIMLMHLFCHQELIPESWKNYTTLGFPGTVVETSRGNKAILALGWSGKNWYIGVRKLSYLSSAKKPLVYIG